MATRAPWYFQKRYRSSTNYCGYMLTSRLLRVGNSDVTEHVGVKKTDDGKIYVVEAASFPELCDKIARLYRGS